MLSRVEASAQQSKVDSLNKLLQTAKYDTTRLRLYLAIVEVCDINENAKYATPAVKIADKLLLKTISSIERKNIQKQKAKAFEYLQILYWNKRDTSMLLLYQQKRLSVFYQIKDTSSIVNAIIGIGNWYFLIGNFSKALELYQNGLLISRELKYKKGVATALSQKASLYNEQKGAGLQALENYQESLTLWYELNDTNNATYALLMMGNIYGNQNNIKKSLECFHKAISLHEKRNNLQGIRQIYNRIGIMYKTNNDFPNAIINFQKVLSIAAEMNDKNISGVLTNMGDIYGRQGDIIKAEKYFNSALKIANEYNEEWNIAYVFDCLANLYMNQKKYQTSKEYCDSALITWKKQMYIPYIRNAELLSSQIDSAMNNGVSAYEHYKQYIIFRDKLNSEEVRKAATKEKYQNEYDNQRAIAKAEQDKKDAITAEEKRRQNIIIWSVVSGLLLVVVFSIFLFRLFLQKKKANIILAHQREEILTQRDEIEAQRDLVTTQKEHIEEIHKEVTDSINYAKRIQQAKLPRLEEIYSILPQSFILFKPKDIVSGDFYFFHNFKRHAELDSASHQTKIAVNPEVSGRNDEKVVIIAAADCTGHGVPGAFMSMIGSERLEDAVLQTTDTTEILKHLNIGIKTSLQQSNSEESTRDGMDIAICSVDIENRIVTYAGANRPLWIIRNGKAEIEETKATKKAIGGLTEDDQHFESHVLNLQQGDTFYLFSDGYADQFNSEDKKLMTRKFKEILLSIQNISMEEQKEYLNTFIENWKLNTEQTDDILVIGIRI